MSEPTQRVVVIGDASRDVSLSALQLALNDLQLNPGDKLVLLGKLHQAVNPSVLSLMAGIFLGHRSRMDPSSILEVNQRILNEELARKKEEYMNNKELNQIQKKYESAKEKFLYK